MFYNIRYSNALTRLNSGTAALFRRPALRLIFLLALAGLLVAALLWGSTKDLSAAASFSTQITQIPGTLKIVDTPPTGIGGTVTAAGAPAADILLTLYYYSDGQWTAIAQTTSDETGYYHFDNLAQLLDGKMYYVRYGPNLTEPAHVYSWYGPLIKEYLPTQYVSGGNFDIAEVTLLTPVSGAEESLPTTFSWEKRSVTTDSYRVALYDQATGSYWSSADFGYADKGTLTSLPSSISPGKQYGWYVEVYATADSFGESFMLNDILFLSNGAPTHVVHMPVVGGIFGGARSGIGVAAADPLRRGAGRR